MESAAVELFKAMGVGEHSRRSGDAVPDVTLLDSRGRPVRLSDVWAEAPLVVIFFRGGWCNYCNLQLRAWQSHAEELDRLGAKVLAISPQTPRNTNGTIESNELAYTVLSDSSLEAAEGFGIAFTLPPELIDYFASVGTDIPVLNGNGLWVLPVPATYVVDTNGVIRFCDVEADYRQRAHPRDAISIIEAMIGS